MMRKKTAIFISVCVFILGVIGILLFVAGNRNVDSARRYQETDVSKYRWIELLTEQSGMTEYRSEQPYYRDVAPDDRYFTAVQSAVEWGLLEGGASFHGRDPASGRFVAITAIKSIGERKLQIYLGTGEALKDKDYLQIALDHAVISRDDLDAGISETKAEQILEQLETLYFSEFWKTDVEHVVYQDGVIEIDREAVVSYDEEAGEIVLDDVELSEGDIIRWQEQGAVIAKKIREVTGDQSYRLEQPEIEEVLQSLEQSAIRAVTFQDIVNSYGEEYLSVAEAENHVQSMQVSHTEYGKAELKGFEIAAEAEDGEVKITIKDNTTGVELPVPVSPKTKLEHLEVTMNVNQLLIGTQIKYNALIDVEYASVAVDIDSDLKGAVVSGEIKPERFPMFEAYVPVISGVVGVNIQLYLVVTLEGEVYLEAGLPIQSAVHYEKGHGIRDVSPEPSVKIPNLEAEAEVSKKIGITGILVLLQCPILDLSIDAGVVVSAQFSVKNNAQICMDFHVAFPVLLVTAGDDERDFHGWTPLIAALGISLEKELISADQAPIQWGFHYEVLPNGERGRVEECTYQEQEDSEPEQDPDSTVVQDEPQQEEEKGSNWYGHSYTTQRAIKYGMEYPEFTFQYPDDWTISQEEVAADHEWVILENDRGAQIHYYQSDVGFGSPYYGGAYTMCYAKVTKVEKAAYQPGSGQDTGDTYIVVKVEEYAREDGLTEEGIYEVDGMVWYAVVPESYAGEIMYQGEGYWSELAWERGTSIAVLATSPDGTFTPQEELEIIYMLSTFTETKSL